MKSIVIIASDFDAIAAAMAAMPRREVLTSAERAILRHIPAHARRALDVGCGDGLVTRAMTRRGMNVLGIDLSPRMVAPAQARTEPGLPIEYRVADIVADMLPHEAFDAVLTINMVHHVPLAEVVQRLVRAVAPGGVLLIQDVVTRSDLRYLPVNVLARLCRWLGRLRSAPGDSRSVAALYDAHGAREVYLNPRQVVPAYRALLPGARVLHHLEWRYSVIWHRPPAT